MTNQHPSLPWNFITLSGFLDPSVVCLNNTEKKQAYTTTTEKKSFGELFWPQRKTFQAGGGFINPTETRKTHIHHRNLSSVDPIFSAKKSSALEQGGVWLLLPRQYLIFVHPRLLRRQREVAKAPGECGVCEILERVLPEMS